MNQHLHTIGRIHDQPDPHVPSRQELASDEAWAHLYRAVHSVPAAAEVVRYCTANPDAVRRLEPLYLIARETMHVSALADAQRERTNALLRAVFVTVPVRTLRLAATTVFRIVRPSGDTAAVPKTGRPRHRSSPAKARVDGTGRQPDIAPVLSVVAEASDAPPVSAGHEAARDASS